MKGEDIDADFVEPKLEEFVKNNTERAIICFERGDLENHLHVQALMVAVATTPAQFKLSVEKALGYEKGKRPVNLSICLRQLTGKGIHTVEGIVGYCRKAKDSVDFREVCHNITDKDKAKGDLLFILHGKSDSSKAKVALTSHNIISKMQVFLKYKTKTILRHMRDPLCLILKMMRTGHYELPSYWVQEKGGLDLVRFNSLWKSNVSPEELEVKDIVKMFCFLGRILVVRRRVIRRMRRRILLKLVLPLDSGMIRTLMTSVIVCGILTARIRSSV